MKYEIKDKIIKELRNEMKIENDKLKADYNTRISSLSGKLESVVFTIRTLSKIIQFCASALER
jgi:hypothetical protein